MKIRYISIFIMCFAFVGCNDEEAAGPGSTDTFIKLFGSEHIENANDMVVEADGSVVMLSTTQIEEGTGFSYKVKIIKVDALGNTLWQRTYPTENFEETNLSYVGSSILKNGEGYLIIGDRINANNKTSLLILNVNQQGEESSSGSFTLGYTTDTTSIHGVDAVLDDTNELRVIGLIDTTANEIWVGTFDANTLTLDDDCVFRNHSGGLNTRILKSAFLDSNYEFVYGIGVRVNQENGKFVKIPRCRGTEITGNLLINTTSNAAYTVNAMTESLNGYAIVGTTNVNGDNDIFMAKVNALGVVDGDIIVIGTLPDNTVLSGEELGLSIDNTADGGFLIGAATTTNSAGENDLLIVKTNFIGEVRWSQQFGDENDERVIVTQDAPNGGYYILGNTEFGGINTLILIKTDRSGNLQ